jgi:hypothetical protein
MDNPILDFAKKSFLFNEGNIRNRYQGWSEKQLQDELAAYRELCLSEISLSRELSSSNLSVLVEGFRRFRPNESLLKQCALYVEDITINDPLFEQTHPKNEMSVAANALIGMKGMSVNRDSVASAASYIQNLKPAIEAEFVNFVPLNHLHEPPKEIPVFYSENLFFDLLPEHLLNFFRSNAQVCPLVQVENGWIPGRPEDLAPCRGVEIYFGDDRQTSMIYFLHHQEFGSLDEETGVVKVFISLPPSPPDAGLFENWISQSINRTAHTVFTHVFDELVAAQRMKASYLTNSTFVAELLRKSLPETKLKEDVLNLLLGLELPVVEGTSLKRLLDIRQKDGEAFQSFRLELERRLRDLRNIEDPYKLKIEIENAAHELSEVQVNEINKKLSRLRKGLISDAVILLGGLVTVFQSGGLSLPLVAYGLGHGFKTYSEFESEKKENPVFFLWELKQAQGRKRGRKS